MIYLDWFIKIFASGMRHQRKFSSFYIFLLIVRQASLAYTVD